MLSVICCVEKPYRKPFLRLFIAAEGARGAPRGGGLQLSTRSRLDPLPALVCSAKRSTRHAHATRVLVPCQATGRSAPCCSYHGAHAAAALAVRAVECRKCPWRTSIAHSEPQQAPARSHLRCVSTVYRYYYCSPDCPFSQLSTSSPSVRLST